MSLSSFWVYTYLSIYLFIHIFVYLCKNCVKTLSLNTVKTNWPTQTNFKSVLAINTFTKCYKHFPFLTNWNYLLTLIWTIPSIWPDSKRLYPVHPNKLPERASGVPAIPPAAVVIWIWNLLVLVRLGLSVSSYCRDKYRIPHFWKHQLLIFIKIALYFIT